MGKEIDKINMFFTDMEARKRMRVSLGQIPGILVTSSIPNNLEINAAGADKGSALLRLAEFLGIGREETMAFGTEKMICPCSGQPVWGLPWKMERSR